MNPAIELTLTRGERTIEARAYEPTFGPKAAVVILGAVACPQHYYRAFSRWLSTQGYAVLTFDYRGVGASRGADARAERATLWSWAHDDATAAMETARRRWPDVPLLAVCHSFGGQALGITPAAFDLDAAVLVGSQHGHWRHWSGLHAAGVALAWWGLVPAVANTLGYVPGKLGLGEDLPAPVARQWARWGRDPDYIRGVEQGNRVHYEQLRLPMLAYGFTDDAMAPPAAVESLLGWFERARIERRQHSPADVGVGKIGHFGFFRPAFEETLWRDTLVWMERHAVQADEAVRRSA